MRVKADHVLRDCDNVIRVFIHASKEYRVNRIMEMYGDTREAAVEHRKRSDHARAAYYRNISGQKWGTPHNYTLCIDVSVGVEKCVKEICDLVGDYL